MPIPFYFGSLSCVITVMSGVVCECLALPRRFCLHFQIVVETGGGGTRHTHTHTDTQQAPCGLAQARRSQLGFPCRARISCMHIELYTVIDSADPSIHSFIDTDGWWSACVNGRQRCRCSSITLHCVWALHNIFSANFCILFFCLFIFSLFMDMEEWLLFVRAMRRLCDGVVTQRCWPSPSTGWQTHFRLMRKLLETFVSTAEDNHSSVSNTWVTLTCQSVFTNLINRLCTLRGSGI